MELLKDLSKQNLIKISRLHNKEQKEKNIKEAKQLEAKTKKEIKENVSKLKKKNLVNTQYGTKESMIKELKEFSNDANIKKYHSSLNIKPKKPKAEPKPKAKPKAQPKPVAKPTEKKFTAEDKRKELEEKLKTNYERNKRPKLIKNARLYNESKDPEKKEKYKRNLRALVKRLKKEDIIKLNDSPKLNKLLNDLFINDKEIMKKLKMKSVEKAIKKKEKKKPKKDPVQELKDLKVLQFQLREERKTIEQIIDDYEGEERYSLIDRSNELKFQLLDLDDEIYKKEQNIKI